MNKREFLDELENALEGKLPEEDIKRLRTDYNSVFVKAAAEGRSEEDVAAEIGSPAKIVRSILENAENRGKRNDQRDYTDFQRNINEKTSKIFDRVVQPDRSIELAQLAPMGRRLGAYIIDGIFLGLILYGLIALIAMPLYFLRSETVTQIGHAMIPYSVSANIHPRMFMGIGGALSALINLFLLFGGFNLLSVFFLWGTNGFTPGKWLLKMRVVKTNNSRITFLDALLREVVIKFIGNALLSGLLNVGSFIWGCVTDDHKTVHDLVAQTRVVNWDKEKAKLNYPD